MVGTPVLRRPLALRRAWRRHVVCWPFAAALGQGGDDAHVQAGAGPVSIAVCAISVTATAFVAAAALPAVTRRGSRRNGRTRAPPRACGAHRLARLWRRLVSAYLARRRDHVMPSVHSNISQSAKPVSTSTARSQPVSGMATSRSHSSTSKSDVSSSTSGSDPSAWRSPSPEH